MKESDATIIELEGKASQATGETKVTYQKQIKDLKAKQAVATKKLDEMANPPAPRGTTPRKAFPVHREGGGRVQVAPRPRLSQGTGRAG
jgi:hypothetical protein